MLTPKILKKLQNKKTVIFKSKIDGLYCRLEISWNYKFNSFCPAFIVHKSRRIANDWIKKPIDKVGLASTGNGSIKPLLWMMNILSQLGNYFPIFVWGANEQRLRVYKRLISYGWIYYPFIETLLSPYAHLNKKDIGDLLELFY